MGQHHSEESAQRLRRFRRAPRFNEIRVASIPRPPHQAGPSPCGRATLAASRPSAQARAAVAATPGDDPGPPVCPTPGSVQACFAQGATAPGVERPRAERGPVGGAQLARACRDPAEVAVPGVAREIEVTAAEAGRVAPRRAVRDAVVGRPVVAALVPPGRGAVPAEVSAAAGALERTARVERHLEPLPVVAVEAPEGRAPAGGRSARSGSTSSTRRPCARAAGRRGRTARSGHVRRRHSPAAATVGDGDRRSRGRTRLARARSTEPTRRSAGRAPGFAAHARRRSERRGASARGSDRTTRSRAGATPLPARRGRRAPRARPAVLRTRRIPVLVPRPRR